MGRRHAASCRALGVAYEAAMQPGRATAPTARACHGQVAFGQAYARFVTRRAHQRLPLSSVRLTTPAVHFVGCCVCCLVAENLTQQIRIVIEEPVGQANSLAPQIVATDGRREASRKLDLYAFFEARYVPCARPLGDHTVKLAGRRYGGSGCAVRRGRGSCSSPGHVTAAP